MEEISGTILLLAPATYLLSVQYLFYRPWYLLLLLYFWCQRTPRYVHQHRTKHNLLYILGLCSRRTFPVCLWYVKEREEYKKEKPILIAISEVPSYCPCMGQVNNHHARSTVALDHHASVLISLLYFFLFLICSIDVTQRALESHNIIIHSWKECSLFELMNSIDTKKGIRNS